jgi:3-oxoacyl-(acyl-carrier-protein) synthase
MLRRHPVITGAGIVSAAGCSVVRVWETVRAGRSGLGPLTLFASTRFGHHLVGQVREDVDVLAGPVRGSRSDKLAWIAAREAFDQARLKGCRGLHADRFGVVLGATTGGMLGTEVFLARLLREQKRRFGPLRFHECASSTDLLARQLGARGPTATFSTACSAGAMAIAAAAELIESGEADVVLTGGCDSLCRLTLNGFGSLLLLDPRGCRPFDLHRAGISLGEGAAILVLEAEETARSRGAEVLGCLSGWGASCDAFHPTAPHPDGDGALAAMRQALERAGLAVSDIGFVSAHGTGTPDNDAMEAKALRRLFGNSLPPVSSTMRFFGHTLAASGALKAVLCLQAIGEQAVPPNLGWEHADPALGFEPVREFLPHRVTHILSNSFGFGGNNVALVLSPPEAATRRTNTAPLTRSEAHGPREPLPEEQRRSRREETFEGDRPSQSLVTSTPTPGRNVPMRALQRMAPSPERLAVLAVGIVSAAGRNSLDYQVALQRGIVPTTLFVLPGASPTQRVSVLACRDFDAEQLIDPAQRRRLNRLQQMAIVAARQALPAGLLAAAPRDRICVTLGTGLGSLNDTAAFVENLILKEERSPRPLFFTNSVHNALASQVALDLGLTGLNSTSTHRETSFELALWQGATELTSGRASLALVGAADELNSHVVAAGLRWGWWDEATASSVPGLPRSNRRRLAPGEGCAVFTLAAGSLADHAPLAWVSAIRIGRTAEGTIGSLEAGAEADWILETLERAGEPPTGIDLLLTNAAPGLPGEAPFFAVAAALAERLGREFPAGTYRQYCGELASASAFGFTTALALVRGEILPAHCGATLVSAREPACRKVVLYTLSPAGTKGMCCLSA